MLRFVADGVRAIFLAIDTTIYTFINSVYEIFLNLATMRFFTEDFFLSFANRIYVIIGVVMLFVITYSLLKAIVNPDEFTKGDNSVGKLVTNIVISLVLIAVIPTVFRYIYIVQDAVMQTNAIGTLIMGRANTYTVEGASVDLSTVEGVNPEYCPDGNCVVSWGATEINMGDFSRNHGGKLMAVTAFQPFFYLSPGFDDWDTRVTNPLWGGFGWYIGAGAFCALGIATLKFTAFTTIGAVASVCGATFGTAGVATYTGQVAGAVAGEEQTLDSAWAEAMYSGNFGHFTAFNEHIGTRNETGPITYHWILSTIAGIFVLFVLVSFCFDLGIRAVKLGFYQLIAPIPILARIIPGQKKIFDNWVKAVGTTFLELFIRVAIIYFGVLLISQTHIVFDNIWETSAGWGSWFVRNLTRLFVMFGILVFMKQAPKLISNIFGIDSGNISLGIKDKLSAVGAGITGIPVIGGLATRGLGATTGAVGAGITGWRQGGIAGLKAGLATGAMAGGKEKGWQFGKLRNKHLQDLTGNPDAQTGLFGGQKYRAHMAKAKLKDASEEAYKRKQGTYEGYDDLTAQKSKLEEDMQQQRSQGYQNAENNANLQRTALQKEYGDRIAKMGTHPHNARERNKLNAELNAELSKVNDVLNQNKIEIESQIGSLYKPKIDSIDDKLTKDVAKRDKFSSKESYIKSMNEYGSAEADKMKDFNKMFAEAIKKQQTTGDKDQSKFTPPEKKEDKK